MNGSSKGDQEKRLSGSLWYKKQKFGYEPIAEFVVSRMLSHAVNIDSVDSADSVDGADDVDSADGADGIDSADSVDYVDYTIVSFDKDIYDNPILWSVSKDFIANTDYSIITLNNLFMKFSAIDLDKLLQSNDVKYKINAVAKEVARITKLKDFGVYLTNLLAVTAIVLNEDLHTNNICVLYGQKTNDFFYCPFFDFGLSLLSDINDYRLNENPGRLYGIVKSKPFMTSFSKQLDYAEALFPSTIRFALDISDIENIVAAVDGPDIVKRRIFKVLEISYKQYGGYFVSRS